MAHKIIGLDLGASATKVSRYDARFRNATLLDEHVFPVEPAAGGNGGGGVAERMAERLAGLPQLLEDQKITADELFLALPGELCTFRLVDLPFADERRIESVLGYELESQVMTAIDELVLDHIVVGARGQETRVLVAAAPRAQIAELVAAAASKQLALRVVGSAPVALAALAGDAARAEGGVTLIADVGHETTTVCILRDGAIEMARTIARGGRHFTDAIAAAFRLDKGSAEKTKQDVGFIGHAAMAAQSVSQSRMDACLREAARPLVRELRQTLAAYRASYAASVDRVWLTGGGARLVGLREHVAEELGVPAQPLPAAGEGISELRRGGNGQLLAVARGMAQVGLGATPRVNFRKGELAYRSDFSFLRGKALHVGLGLLAIFFFAVLSAAASLSNLRKEHDVLAARLKKETTELFGEPRLDARAISDELKGGAKSVVPPIPTVTGFDLLDEIARRVPPGDKVKLDITELDIKPKKTFIKGTAETAAQVDELVDGLKKIDCFADFQPGKLSTVTGPPPPRQEGDKSDKPPERVELKQFTLTINTTCP